MPGVEERVMASRLQSIDCTISTTVASLILWSISSQLPDGTGTFAISLGTTWGREQHGTDGMFTSSYVTLAIT
jgi:hypothetical protein